jgi:RimJ/RimL family protein N-acetyltransferase
VTVRLHDTSNVPRANTTFAGRHLHFRPLQDGEREPLVEVFNGMSARSRYLRFLYPVPRLTESMLRALSTVDGHNKLALGAFSDGGCLAIARFSRIPERPHAAELAVSVVDSMQRRGLGRLLLTMLAGIAAELDITTFAVTVHPDNRGSLALLRSFSAQLRLIDRIHEGHLAVSAILRPAWVPTPSLHARRAPKVRPDLRVRCCLP